MASYRKFTEYTVTASGTCNYGATVTVTLTYDVYEYDDFIAVSFDVWTAKASGSMSSIGKVKVIDVNNATVAVEDYGMAGFLQITDGCVDGPQQIIYKTHLPQAEKYYVLEVTGYTDQGGSNDTVYAFKGFYVQIPMKDNFQVTYNANGGSGTTDAQTKWRGEALKLQENGFTRQGYSFKRWNTAANDSGTAYEAGANYTGDSALNLHAIWNRTVTYDANGHGTAPSAQAGVSTAAMALGTMSAEGWYFVGWNTAQDGSGDSYTASYPADLPNVTLYAQWEAWIDSLTIGDVTAIRAEAEYEQVTTQEGANPSEEHWFERIGDTYVQTSDTAVVLEKAYYRQAVGDKEADEGTFLHAEIPYVVKGEASADVTLVASLADNGGNVITSFILEDGQSFDQAALELTQVDTWQDRAYGTGCFIVKASGLDENTGYVLSVSVRATNTSAEQPDIKVDRSAIIAVAYFTMDVLGDAYLIKLSEDKSVDPSKTYYKANGGEFEPITEHVNLLINDAVKPSKWSTLFPNVTSIDSHGSPYEAVLSYSSTISGWEVVSSPAIPVEAGVAYRLSLDYSVGKAYETYSGGDGYFGVSVCSSVPAGGKSSAQTTVYGHIAFPTVVTERTRGSVTFTPAGDVIYITLNGGDINDGQTDLSFLLANVKLEKEADATGVWGGAVDYYDATGPKPGHGISFGSPAKYDGFNVSMPQYYYEQAIAPVCIQSTEPSRTDMLWLDTSSTSARLKYHNGSAWTPLPSVWG